MMTHDEWKMEWCIEQGNDDVLMTAICRAIALINSDYQLDDEAHGKTKFIMLVYRVLVERKWNIPHPIELWVATAFDKYLRNECSTLNQAFQAKSPSKGKTKKSRISCIWRNMIVHILIRDFDMSIQHAAELLTTSTPIPTEIPENIKHFIQEGRANSSTPESIIQYYYQASPPTEIEKLNAVTDWRAFSNYTLVIKEKG